MTGGAKPGYRRRIVVDPGPGEVTARLEDDFHHMRVTLRHDGQKVLRIVPEMLRWPWTTCPEAEGRLIATFADLPLAEVTSRQDKKRNCTHLHDLAVLAAAHAADRTGLTYDIEADDPVDGRIEQRLWRNGELLFVWQERDGRFVAPAEISGQTLFTLRDWIAGLPEPQREAARLMQWASIVAHGRTIPAEQQREASQMPPNCHTFQPEQTGRAQRTYARRDFSLGNAKPLEGA